MTWQIILPDTVLINRANCIPKINKEEEKILKQILKELQEQNHVRANLSALRAAIKKDKKSVLQLQSFIREHEKLFLGFLEHEDAKTRKNAALLLGDISFQGACGALYHAYEKEQTRFVRSAYLEALEELDVRNLTGDFKKQLEKLQKEELTDENRKHTEEEIRVLRRILLQYEGMTKHTFDKKQEKNRLLLTVDKNQREAVRNRTGGKVHPLGVIVETDRLESVLLVRTYRELLFPVPVKALLDADPVKAASGVWEQMLALCRKYHSEPEPFYFRIECRSRQELEKRSVFTKRLAAELEKLSSGMLLNSTSYYEVELRLYADRTGRFFPALKFSSLQDHRFSYRKNTISASIHPSTAAQMMELCAPYLKEHALVLDPFCGVGTMLVERNQRVPALEMYGTDIFGVAVEGARENARLAGAVIQFIRRDFFEFEHDFLFDEIITNMPVRGKMTKEELNGLYEDFFRKAPKHLAESGVIIMYTQELGFVKKQLRLHRRFQLLMEHCMQEKSGFYLLVIGV